MIVLSGRLTAQLGSGMWVTMAAQKVGEPGARIDRTRQRQCGSWPIFEGVTGVEDKEDRTTLRSGEARLLLSFFHRHGHSPHVTHPALSQPSSPTIQPTFCKPNHGSRTGARSPVWSRGRPRDLMNTAGAQPSTQATGTRLPSTSELETWTSFRTENWSRNTASFLWRPEGPRCVATQFQRTLSVIKTIRAVSAPLTLQ